MLEFLKKIFGSSQDRLLKKFSRIVQEVNSWELKFSSLSDDEIRSKTSEFKARYQKGETLDELLPEAYALVKNVCRRLCGTEIHVSGYNQKWDMVPYDVQIVGAIAMHRGFISEMQTGEGKTLTATLPLYLNALTGEPVHLVTVNDYLAQRDCEWVGTVLRWLGLTTGVLTNNTPTHTRKEIYTSDVVYGTASEFGFDYLRDNSMSFTKEDQVQRGYFFAIIDEVDSILVDEARTPLIISGPSSVSRQMYGELKDQVSELVKIQRDHCNRLASEAKKNLDKILHDEGEDSTQKKELSDKDQKELKETYRKLWLISKGTPQNKVLKRAKENPDIRAEIDRWDIYFYSEQNKEERAQILSELYIVIDEKNNEFEITDKGIQAWSMTDGGTSDDFLMLDLGEEYANVDLSDISEEERMQRKLALNEEDAKRKERSHNLRQLLRAHLMMEKDIDYIIEEGKVVIIDEHTGRPQPGRRFSDGLHQAIEAKEGVEIQRETQTYATITLQNYFRMYKKLAGMTGTAITEAGEFKEIYKLDVLQIPTYKDCKRNDFNDEVYMTEREKYNAILREVKEIHEKGRPILIGTESVEVSEKLSRILKLNKIEHTVLNAKNHAKEAEIIADAGKRAAVTVATNMAGRGTDIKLKEGAASVGGLHVIGTTRHQSRRIDRQLRGRSARLGDPGSSKFFISFEDHLLRLFASPRLTAMLKRFRPPEGEAISAGILNKSIETAQKRVEGRNYTIRKYTLEYDDVMNRQRQEVYSYRNDILRTPDIVHLAEEQIDAAVDLLSKEFLQSRSSSELWDPESFRTNLMTYFPIRFEESFFDDDFITNEEIEQKTFEKILKAFREKYASDLQKIKAQNPEVDALDVAQEALRGAMIRKIDQLWQEHLLMMDHLRAEVNLRTVGQKDPLLEFKHEAFKLFHELTRRLRLEMARSFFRIEMTLYQPSLLDQIFTQLNLETDRLIFNDTQMASPSLTDNPNEDYAKTQENARKEDDEPTSPIVVEPRVKRNESCPCNSGKKFKKCCGTTD